MFKWIKRKRIKEKEQEVFFKNCLIVYPSKICSKKGFEAKGDERYISANKSNSESRNKGGGE